MKRELYFVFSVSQHTHFQVLTLLFLTLLYCILFCCTTQFHFWQVLEGIAKCLQSISAPDCPRDKNPIPLLYSKWDSPSLILQLWCFFQIGLGPPRERYICQIWELPFLSTLDTELRVISCLQERKKSPFHWNVSEKIN